MKWELLDRQDIKDFDGNWTDCSLYTNGKEFICICGDADFYKPEYKEYAYDFETDCEAEAWERFYALCREYSGETDDDYDFWKEMALDHEVQERLEATIDWENAIEIKW